MSGTRVLVTGGAGYIGAHACKALHAAGYLPVVFDNLCYGHREDVRWGPFVHGDITDREALARAMREHRPAAVLHFAAFAYVGESVADPGRYYRNNVCGSLALLEAMRDHGVRNLVFSSTCAVYGVPERIPIPEEHPRAPINPYGWTKLHMERMMADFADAHDLRFVALRYFNAAGADPEGALGERHDPESHLIPLVLDAALGRRPAITLFGSDYPTPDGTCVRDYIHVSDLADAHLLALARLEAGGTERAFNLGNGSGHSVREVIAAAERVSGRRIPVVYGERRAGDPPALVGDAARACAILGWRPQRAELDLIVRDAWNHRKALGGR
jgi:UDP-arabinose 4-epimerase